MKQFLYILILLLSNIIFAQSTSLFEQGNTHYNNGKYNEAITSYETVLKNGKHSAELYFNLGNANYKLNNIAPSIYYFEKALLLDSNNKDIKNNLVFAKNMTIDAIDTVPEIGLTKFIKNTSNTFSFDVWAILSVVLVILFVVLFISYYFAYSTSRKRLSFVGSFAALFFCLVFLVFAFNKFKIDSKNQPAIVFAQKSEVKTDPNLSSEQAFVLHEGTKVQVLDTVNNWKQIKIANGKTGWISSDDIKLLKNI